MKKSFILAAASVVALAACTKQTIDTTPDKEIAFQVAKYVTATKAEDSKVKYDPAATFGTYAIFTNGTATEAKDDFMSNVEIGLSGNTWAPVKNAYYWPKTGTLDFVSYSPYASNASDHDKQWIAPVIVGHAYTKLVADGVTPAHTFADGKEYTVDLMYSDVALKCKSNSSTNLDGDSETNYTAGVPTLFRHALSKLNFNVVLSFNDVLSGTGDNEIYTSWEVKVSSMKIKDVAQKGSLTLEGYNSTGVWNLPENKIWTPAEGNTADIVLIKSDDPKSITTTSAALLSNYYVMPQAIADAMKLALTFEIKTYRYASSKGAGNYEDSDLFLTETATIDNILLNTALVSETTSTKITNWEMSKLYTYNIKLAPAKGDDAPIEITYDPATTDWTPVTGVIKVEL